MEITDSPRDWVAKHIREYEETDGRKGHRKWGMDSLLVITRGRKSGKLRRTALFYGRDGDRYVVVGSNGGDDGHPSWYLNMLDHPEVAVQVKADKFQARAVVSDGAERDRLWRMMAGLWPEYDNYRAKARREIPVVILEPRRAQDGEPADLPDKLGAPARRALEGAGLVRLAQLTEVTEQELKKLHGMGPKALGQLRTALAERGLSFRDEG